MYLLFTIISLPGSPSAPSLLLHGLVVHKANDLRDLELREREDLGGLGYEVLGVLLLDAEADHVGRDGQERGVHGVLLVQGGLHRVLDVLLLEVGHGGTQAEEAEEPPELQLREELVHLDLLDQESLFGLFELVVSHREEQHFLHVVHVTGSVTKLAQFHEDLGQVVILVLLEPELVLQAVPLDGLHRGGFQAVELRLQLGQKLLRGLRLDGFQESGFDFLVGCVIFHVVLQGLGYEVESGLLPTILLLGVLEGRQGLHLAGLRRLLLPQLYLLDPPVHVVLQVPEQVDLMDGVLLEDVEELHCEFL